MRVNRLAELEDYIQKNKRASISELCECFNVSLNTIRRDIAALERTGLIVKVYGGVMLREESGVVPFLDRKSAFYSEKLRIGKLAAPLIKSGDTIYIDSGTTTPMILQYLGELKQVTVVSNSLSVYVEASKYPHLQFIAPGGVFFPKTNSFVGLSTVSSLKDFQISIAFMAATAFSIENGAMNNSFHEAEVKKSVIKHAKKIALLIDHSKLDSQAGIRLCDIDELDYLVTDKRLPEVYETSLKAAGVVSIY